jgi:phosphatidylserine synthase
MEPVGSLLHPQEPTTCPYSEPDQSSPPPPCDPTSWKSILILLFHLCLHLPSGLFLSGFPTKTLYSPFIFPICATLPTHLILHDLMTRIISSEEYKSLCSSLYSLLYLVPLRPKYLHQHSVLQHPRPTFLPQYARLSITPIQTNRQNYIYVYSIIFMFLDSKVEDKILYQMIKSIPWLKPARNLFLNGILVSCFQVFKLFHPFKGFIINLYIEVFSCILTLRHDHVLSFLSIYF